MLQPEPFQQRLEVLVHHVYLTAGRACTNDRKAQFGLIGTMYFCQIEHVDALFSTELFQSLQARIADSAEMELLAEAQLLGNTVPERARP